MAAEANWSVEPVTNNAEATWSVEPVMNTDNPMSHQSAKGGRRQSTKELARAATVPVTESPSSAGIDLLIFTGWLTKQGIQYVAIDFFFHAIFDYSLYVGSFIKNWKRRFFRLSVLGSRQPKTAVLAYFTSADTASTPARPGFQGFIALEGASLQVGSDTLSFSVTTKEGKVLLMRAATEPERAAWLRQIEEVLRLVASGAGAPAVYVPPTPTEETPSWLSSLGGVEN